MAKKLGISQKGYSKIERGDIKLNTDYISHISLINPSKRNKRIKG